MEHYMILFLRLYHCCVHQSSLNSSFLFFVFLFLSTFGLFKCICWFVCSMSLDSIHSQHYIILFLNSFVCFCYSLICYRNVCKLFSTYCHLDSFVSSRQRVDVLWALESYQCRAAAQILFVTAVDLCCWQFFSSAQHGQN